MKRTLLLVAALALPAAHAQVQTTTLTPVIEVRGLAPQLIAFTGSEVNFANIVNGLALGVPVTLTTPLATGGMQVFTFTPSGTMTSLQIAQLLETARQSLIARGIAAPTAQQLGTVLTGGTLTTASGATALNALVNTATTPGATGATVANTQSPAAAIQNANSTVNANNAAAGGTAPRNMSDSPLPRGIADTPPLPVPGATAPLNTTAIEAARPAVVTPVVPAVPAVAAPAVRLGDR